MRILVFALLLAACQPANEARVLFEGEFEVRSDGIYTYAHYYEHLESKRRVVIVGMNHGGDKEYFEHVARILESAEVVLYEGLPPGQQDTIEEVENERRKDLQKLRSDNIDEAFYAALRSYFRTAHEYLQLVEENSAFDYSKAGWESGDAAFFTRLKDDHKLQKFLEELQRDLVQLAPERKMEVVKFVRRALQSIENGQFTKSDFGDGFVFLWSDQKLTGLLLEALGKPRDETVMERFDELVVAKDPRVIGIKFGAAHIAYQRKLLEQRGYRLQRSIELRNIAF